MGEQLGKATLAARRGNPDPLQVVRNRFITLNNFQLDDLAQFTREGSFRRDSSSDFRQLYVGRDDVHGALKYVLARVSSSLKLDMFGYDDEELDQVIGHLVDSQHVFFQGTLDQRQYLGKHEQAIAAGWSPQLRSSFAIGATPTGQIVHTKGGVCDGIVGFSGSVNWSASGEGEGIGLSGALNAAGFKAQYNTLAFFTDPAEVHKFSIRLDEEHVEVLARNARLAQKEAEK